MPVVDEDCAKRTPAAAMRKIISAGFFPFIRRTIARAVGPSGPRPRRPPHLLPGKLRHFPRSASPYTFWVVGGAFNLRIAVVNRWDEKVDPRSRMAPSYQ